MFLSLGVVWLAASCAPYHSGWTRIGRDKARFTPVFLSPPAFEASFTIHFTAMDQRHSGILALKKESPSRYKLAVLHETGGKLLAASLVSGKLTVEYAVPDINRKIIIRVLEQVFSSMLLENTVVRDVYREDSCIIYHAVEGKKNIYYYVRQDRDDPEKAIAAFKRNRAVEYHFIHRRPEFPDVNIRYLKNKLEIQLYLLTYHG